MIDYDSAYDAGREFAFDHRSDNQEAGRDSASPGTSAPSPCQLRCRFPMGIATVSRGDLAVSSEELDGYSADRGKVPKKQRVELAGLEPATSWVRLATSRSSPGGLDLFR